MKLLIIFTLFLSKINEYRCQDSKESGEIEFTSNNDGYSYSFRTKDIERSETANYDPNNVDDIHLNIVGYYSYKGTDGRLYRVEYEANDRGFLPKLTIINLSEEGKPVVQRIGTPTIKSLVGGGIG